MKTKRTLPTTKQIRALLKKGATQGALAKKFHCSQSTISVRAGAAA